MGSSPAQKGKSLVFVKNFGSTSPAWGGFQNLQETKA
jgi:hypothetical protein